ncbi:OsmC family protein [Myroides sp. LJL115]
MENKHFFKATLHWSLKVNNSQNKPRTSKNHQVEIQDKALLDLSAAKQFKGDPSLHNPEDLLLSALSSCHMMSFLYVCQQKDIVVLDYKDQSLATLALFENQSGRITQVDLHPKIIFETSVSLEQVEQLHQIAHKLCFISNSCNFPIFIHVQ